MTPDELHALADALDHITPAMGLEELHHLTTLDRTADYLRACADAKPVGYFGKSPIDDAWIEMESWATNVIALYAHPAPQAEPKRDWSTIDAAIREHLDNYELIGEDDSGADACYTPTERELYLIYDAINGLLADESFVAAISASQAEPKRELLSDDEILDIATAAGLRFSMYSDDVETRAAIKRLARAIEREHGIGGSDE